MQPSILVIDDSPTVCKLLEVGLGRAGYQVIAFQDPRQMLFVLFVTGQIPFPDLVIVDLMLPYIDGYRLIKRFREHSKDVPLVVLTRRDGIRDRLKARLAGANAYLTKPFHIQHLVDLARYYLSRQES